MQDSAWICCCNLFIQGRVKSTDKDCLYGPLGKCRKGLSRGRNPERAQPVMELRSPPLLGCCWSAPVVSVLRSAFVRRGLMQTVKPVFGSPPLGGLVLPAVDRHLQPVSTPPSQQDSPQSQAAGGASLDLLPAARVPESSRHSSSCCTRSPHGPNDTWTF